jgi:hypothetical protein
VAEGWHCASPRCSARVSFEPGHQADGIELVYPEGTLILQRCSRKVQREQKPETLIFNQAMEHEIAAGAA